MNPQFLLLVTAIAVYWQTTASFLVPEECADGLEIGRVVGGLCAKPGQFPFAVALHFKNEYICTGSILGERTILTSGHCVVLDGELQPPELFHVIANVNRDEPEQRVEISYITVHDDYANYVRTVSNDIAIMRTKEPIQMNENVSSIGIAKDPPNEPEGCMYVDYHQVLAMGWGSANPVVAPPVLPKTLLYVVQKVVCKNRCGTTGIYTDGKLCATGNWWDEYDGRISSWSGVCHGDSGGPLVEHMGNGTWKLIGALSYGDRYDGCGSPAPAVYADVSYYQDFIVKNSVDEIKFM